MFFLDRSLSRESAGAQGDKSMRAQLKVSTLQRGLALELARPVRRDLIMGGVCPRLGKLS